MSKRIPKLRLPSVDEFRKHYVFTGTPIVLRDLLAGQPIADLSTIAKARDKLAALQISIGIEESRFFLETGRLSTPGDFVPTSFGAYLTDYRTSPMVSFGAVHPELRAMFEPPEHLEQLTCATDEIVYTYYLANAGLSTHLHNDEHMCHNLLYQVFGRKRVVMFPESSSHKLAPVGQMSRCFLQHMDASEQQHFIEFAGGAVAELEPGDALLIPSGMWHYVEYADTGLSISMRFGRSDLVTELIDVLGYHPGCPSFLHIASGLVAGRHSEARYLAAYERIKAQARRPFADHGEKYRHFRALFDALVRELCPDRPVIFWHGDADQELQAQFAHPSSPLGYERYLPLARRYRDAGKVDRARACYEALLRYVPDDTEARRSLAELPSSAA